MTAPPIFQDDHARIAANVQKMLAGGATTDEVEHYLRDIEGLKPEEPTQRQPMTRGVQADATSALPRERLGASGDYEAAEPVLAKALGAPAALLRDVPGGEAAQSAVRALVRGQSYREARSDIRNAEAAAPAALTIPARIAGGALAAGKIPGGPMVQGARFGILQGLAQSDPDVGIKQRIDDAGKAGALSAVTAGIANNAGRIPWGGLAKAVTHPRTAAVKAIGGVIRDAVGEARAPIAAEAAEALVPSADGLIGNGIDNLVDASVNVGPRGLANRVAPLHLMPDVIPAATKDAVAEETPDAVVQVIKNLAPTRHRTQAQFGYFADQFAKRQAEEAARAAAATTEPDLEALLAESLKQVKRGGALNLVRPPTP